MLTLTDDGKMKKELEDWHRPTCPESTGTVVVCNFWRSSKMGQQACI